MFTIEQIKMAHAKVKSGADFPAYIDELKALGVTSYTNYVEDGHTDYYDSSGFEITGPAKYVRIPVAKITSVSKFKEDLLAHQQGKSDYPEFCKQAAAAGVHRWTVQIDQMTCSYLDSSGNELLTENIPTK